MTDILTKCFACNFKTDNVALLNRHIRICENYDEWIKTYKPEYFNCEKCNLIFSSNIYLNNHNCKCKV